MNRDPYGRGDMGEAEPDSHYVRRQPADQPGRPSARGPRPDEYESYAPRHGGAADGRSGAGHQGRSRVYRAEPGAYDPYAVGSTGRAARRGEVYGGDPRGGRVYGGGEAPGGGPADPSSGVSAPPYGVSSPPYGVSAPPYGVSSPPYRVSAPPYGGSGPPYQDAPGSPGSAPTRPAPRRQTTPYPSGDGPASKGSGPVGPGRGGGDTDWSDDDEDRPKRRVRPAMPLWQELPLLLVVAFCLAVLIRTFLLQAFYIPSGSMQETLAIGDRVLVNKIVYDVRQPARGEVVVFRGTDRWAPEPGTLPSRGDGFFGRLGHTVGDLVGVSEPSEKDFIKRVIGLPGDTVACCDEQGRVTVNGYGLDEPYVTDNSPLDLPPSPGECRSRRFTPVTIPAGRMWVMGDHRAISQDSRCNGTVPVKNVIGRAFVIVWPSSQWGGLPVPKTFAKVPRPLTAAPLHPGAGGAAVPSGGGRVVTASTPVAGFPATHGGGGGADRREIPHQVYLSASFVWILSDRWARGVRIPLDHVGSAT